jgi:hypothetical protein
MRRQFLDPAATWGAVAVQEGDEFASYPREARVSGRAGSTANRAAQQVCAIPLGCLRDRDAIQGAVVDDHDRVRRPECREAAIEQFGAVPNRDYDGDIQL